MRETSTAPVTVPMDNLPSPDTKRWVVRRKAAVLAAVRNGDLTVEEACRRYGLSEEELHAWQRAFDADGLRGLRATRLPAHRAHPRR
jgi:transposase-like protein